MALWPQLAQTDASAFGIKTPAPNLRHQNSWNNPSLNALSALGENCLLMRSVMTGLKDTSTTIHRRRTSYFCTRAMKSLDLEINPNNCLRTETTEFITFQTFNFKSDPYFAKHLSLTHLSIEMIG